MSPTTRSKLFRPKPADTTGALLVIVENEKKVLYSQHDL
jgi:hypothetical protein